MASDALQPDVSIVIALEGDAQRVPNLIAHLERQTHPASRIEILLLTLPYAVGLHDAVRQCAEGAPMPIRVITAKEPYIVSALNEGIHAARGEYVLLLDEDLLPSPHWVEQHLAAQERLGESACTIGALQPHPQLDRHALTAWFMSGARSAGKEEKLPYLDWRRCNFGIRRAALLEAGAFDETFTAPQFADAALAKRLSVQGANGTYLPGAIAYISYPSSFDAELERHYRKGAGLFRLFQVTRDPNIHKRYPVNRNPVRRLLDAMFVPFYIRACRQADENTHTLGHVYTRVFYYQRCLGYYQALRDARLQRR